MDVIRVHAPSGAHAQRLLAALDGGFVSRIQADDAAIVELTPDVETATRLIELFDSLGRWLGDGGLAACPIKFGDRTYILLSTTGRDVNDPAAFLLERTIQLQIALDSRIVIEQAKGILAERHDLSPEDAFDRLRRAARSRRVKLSELAAEVVSSAGKKSDPLEAP
jgi:ANTAR domain